MSDTLTRPAAALSRFRSILTVLDGDARAGARLDRAIDLARAEDAHLSVLALAVDTSMPAYAYGEAAAASMVQMLERARGLADERRSEAEGALSRAGIRGDVEVLVAMARDVASDVAASARFADLAVVSSPYPDQEVGAAGEILDAVLYECDLPVLVLPDDGAAVEPRRVLVGWDGSRQALKAVRGALPFMVRAEAVEVCVVDARGEAPGENVATFLARHDVPVEIAALPRPEGTVSAAIAQRARETGAGLVVMGAYGHSRFRESLMGGVTLDTLRELSHPILIAH